MLHAESHVMLCAFCRFGRRKRQQVFATVDALQDKCLFWRKISFFFGMVKHDVRGHVYELRRKVWHEDLKQVLFSGQIVDMYNHTRMTMPKKIKIEIQCDST